MQRIASAMDRPLEFLSAGQFHSAGCWTHSKRTIDSYELIIGVQGKLPIQQGDDRFDVGPGDVLLLLPYCMHYGYRPSDTALSFYWIHFRYPSPPHLEDDLPSAPAGGPNATVELPLFFRPPEANRIDILFRQLQHAANSANRFPLTVDYALTSLYLELAEQADARWESERRELEEPRVSPIAEWIRVHAEQALTVSAVARRHGYHPDYLSRLFRQTFGMSLQEYIHVQKLTRAKTLLTGSNRTVKQIAHEIGFPDDKYFIRLFRKYERLTPTEYRHAYHRVHLNIR